MLAGVIHEDDGPEPRVARLDADHRRTVSPERANRASAEPAVPSKDDGCRDGAVRSSTGMPCGARASILPDSRARPRSSTGPLRAASGVFILRIEDTDAERSTEESLEGILDALTWLGLDWDEGPPAAGYRQTERNDIYRAHADRLLAEGKAYRCRCTPALLDSLRAAAQARGETFRYPGTCRDARVPAGEPHALRLRIADTGQTVVEDLLHGTVVFEHSQLDDWIIVRTDGTPTYNFCAVVDDVTMKITHVIRGDDHLSNTPKQVQCYQALGYPTPVFAHVPLILGPDKRRLSKRHGASSVQAFREEGILTEALFNYLARLGWSHGDQEVFSREDVAAHFDLAHVGQAAAVFDRAKLEWLNQHWIKTLPPEQVGERLVPFLERAGLPAPADRAWLGAGGGHAARAGPDPGGDGRGRALLLRAAGGVRSRRGGQVLDARGARALRAPDQAPRGRAAPGSAGSRGALPRAGRRAGASSWWTSLSSRGSR